MLSPHCVAMLAVREKLERSSQTWRSRVSRLLRKRSKYGAGVGRPGSGFWFAEIGSLLCKSRQESHDMLSNEKSGLHPVLRATPRSALSQISTYNSDNMTKGPTCRQIFICNFLFPLNADIPPLNIIILCRPLRCFKAVSRSRKDATMVRPITTKIVESEVDTLSLLLARRCWRIAKAFTK